MAVDIIKMTMDLAVALQSTETYKNLEKARIANDNDEQLQQMLGDFNMTRMTLSNMAADPERDDDKVNELNDKIHALYVQIMNNPSMVAYNMAQKQMENIINYMNDIITAGVNGEDPTEVQPNAGGCSGSCGTCGGCH